MICQECKQRPATLHFTKVVNGEKTEIHICDTCAQHKGDMFLSSGNPGFSIHNLLAGLLNTEQSFADKKVNAFSQKPMPQCSKCGMTYQQFTKIGKFGCSHCYKEFKAQLESILKRVHGGNTLHKGKIPKRMGGNIHLRKELDELKQMLQKHIQQEEFEQAAEMRDRIRIIEKQLSAHREEE
ncbi:UvrB/UvrC motif-containing protein [Bacillus sp. 165]|uniref:UvrB/UvrC motif-containing protein n=1 Tax=Bacillus sp. 165 TaxID=1529117 RepID=UPI001ADCCE35|nr:UvrB/UvrC motif-containing protein [Bacillus sp. 165]MBO9131062.1 UvrB/UvrC motif-containing protein [Bacillus sp. 165]